MKKLILVFIITIIVCANLSAQTNTILTEGFENAGAIPAGWTQEMDANNISWTFTSGTYYTAHGGTYNATFFHASTGKVTKLVTSSLNLSGTTNPQLTFWHIQQYWNGQDELRVYYKTSAGGSWVLIDGAVWTSAVNSWTQRTISLPSPSSTYYIAFEGTANSGNSIGIDDVSVFWMTPFPGSGSGTSGDPYQVSSLGCLSWIAQNTDQWNKYYTQSADIDATATQYWDDADQNGDGNLYNDANDGTSTGNNEGFSPIGNNTTKFTGSYNGMGHTINGLYIKRNSTYFNGLFGYTSSATISNLGVTNVNITGYSENGGMIGRTSLSTTVTYCYSTGSVKGYERYNGGLVGNHGSSSLSNSYSSCSVYAYTSNDYVGGLVGLNVVPSTVANCYSTGAVTGTIDRGGLIGGSAGSPTVNNSFWDKETSGRLTSSGGGTGKTTAEMKQAGTYLSATWDFTLAGNIWAMNGADNNGYPYLRYQNYTPAHIWLGTTSTAWSLAGNWSENSLPSGKVIIPTNDPIIPSSTSATCTNLTIEASGALTISSNASLTVSGTLTNNGAAAGLKIESDAINSGSLIISGTFSGTGLTYQRYMTGGKWHMLGSPLADQAIYSEFINVGANNISDMKGFTESSNNWTALYSSDVEDLTLGKAYAIKTTTDGTVNLNGTPNNVNKTITLARSANGWNLLSNPFTSAIAANTPASENSLLKAANTDNLQDAYAALYIWVEPDDYITGSGVNHYVVVNNSDAATYLQVGQGFFVKAKSNGLSFDITTSMQSHQTATTFKSDVNPWANITLNAEISNAKASTRILYKENMTKGLDISYDAGLLNSYPTFALFSRLVEDNGVNFMIQCLPTDYNELIVPIGLDAKSGEIVKFTAQSVNLPEEYKVYLEDRTLGVFTNLSVVNAEYSIQLLSDSKGTGRFFIRTSIESALGIGDLDLDNPFKVFTRPNNNQIVIRGEANANTIARIYSVTGKQVADFNLKQSSENLVQFNEEAGIYILKISNEQETSTQKFAWVK